MRSNTHRTAAGVAATAVVAALTLGVASPAGAVSVADEASLRAAVGNPAETTVTLTADIDLVDCAAGDLERVSATDLVIEGNGFTIEQTCPGERVLAVSGGGSLTVDHTRLTGGTPALNGGGAMRVLGHAEVRAGSVIEGNAGSIGGGIVATSLLVLDSTVSGNTSTLNGGGLFADDLEVRRSTLEGNQSGSHGGAIAAGTVLIVDSDLSGNDAQAGGVLQAGFITVEGSTFTDNQARETHGGAILVNGGTADITGSTFGGNTAVEQGGALGTVNGPVTVAVTGSTFEDNSADRGGAMYVDGELTVSSSTLHSNAVVRDGGAIYSDGSVRVQDGSVLSRNAAGVSGGAILGVGPGGIGDGEVVVSGSELLDNAAGAGGGGVFVSGDLTVEGSTVSGNAAFGGGGLSASSGATQVSGSTVSGNDAASAGGGGLNTVDSEVRIDGSTFAGNAAAEEGGGARVFAGSVEVTGATFEANDAAEGGGLFTNRSAAVSSSTFRDNRATATAGGGIHADSASVADSTFAGNRGVSHGGAIATVGDVSVENSTFTDNGALVGGGAIGTDGDMTLTHVTMHGNFAPAGASIGMVTPGAQLTITATVMSAPSTDDCFFPGGVAVTSGGHNRSADATCGLDHATDAEGAADPQLGALADNGGPTATLAPAAGSPLVDAIPAADCALTTDQRGIARPSGAQCDIGAVELAQAAPPVGDPPPTPPVSSEELPRTGAATWPLVAAGLLLIATGRRLVTAYRPA